MVGNFDRWFTFFNKSLLVFLMGAMTALVFANVVARYLFGTSFAWAEELSRFAMIWITFLGGGLALRYGQLVAVEVIQAGLSARRALALRGLVFGLVTAFLIALILLGLQFAIFSWGNRTPVLQIPRGLPYLAVPLGASFLLLHLALGLRRILDGDWLGLEALETEAPLAARAEDGRDAKR